MLQEQWADRSFCARFLQDTPLSSPFIYLCVLYASLMFSVHLPELLRIQWDVYPLTSLEEGGCAREDAPLNQDVAWSELATRQDVPSTSPSREQVDVIFMFMPEACLWQTPACRRTATGDERTKRARRISPFLRSNSHPRPVVFAFLPPSASSRGSSPQHGRPSSSCPPPRPRPLPFLARRPCPLARCLGCCLPPARGGASQRGPRGHPERRRGHAEGIKPLDWQARCRGHEGPGEGG